MLRQRSDVATSFTCSYCRYYWMMSRPPFLCSGCRDNLSFSSSIHGCLTWSFCPAQLVLPSITLLLQLEFCRHDLNMNFHFCKGFTTSVPLILLRLSCCIASSVSYINNAQPPSVPFTAKIPLSLKFPAV